MEGRDSLTLTDKTNWQGKKGRQSRYNTRVQGTQVRAIKSKTEDQAGRKRKGVGGGDYQNKTGSIDTHFFFLHTRLPFFWSMRFYEAHQMRKQ